MSCKCQGKKKQTHPVHFTTPYTYRVSRFMELFIHPGISTNDGMKIMYTPQEGAISPHYRNINDLFHHAEGIPAENTQWQNPPIDPLAVNACELSDQGCETKQIHPSEQKKELVNCGCNTKHSIYDVKKELEDIIISYNNDEGIKNNNIVGIRLVDNNGYGYIELSTKDEKFKNFLSGYFHDNKYKGYPLKIVVRK